MIKRGGGGENFFVDGGWGSQSWISNVELGGGFFWHLYYIFISIWPLSSNNKEEKN